MRVALSSYRSKPHSGGQGVYVRNLSRELVGLGHQVEVFSGPPYPVLDEGVVLTTVPSLDLYRDEDPFRTPNLREFRDRIDVIEFATMCTGGFGEPRTFSWRLARLISQRAGDFDILHDNQSLGPGIVQIARTGLPVVSTVHHPISADRRVELAAASWRRKLSVARWYGFVGSQRRVAQRLDHLITVSPRAAADIVAEFGVAPDRLRAIPVGVDVTLFRPPSVARVPGRLVTITSADVPTKGLSVLLRAVARLSTDGSARVPADGSARVPTDGSARLPAAEVRRRSMAEARVPAAEVRRRSMAEARGRSMDAVPDVSLVVVGQPSRATEALIGELGIARTVTFVRALSDGDLAALMASAEIAVVPSLYEGFSLPAVEAMACATPLVATNVGALPELIGTGSARGVLVQAGDVEELASALTALLASPARRLQMGRAGRARAVEQYSWTSIAARTADYYREIIDAGPLDAQRRRAA